MMKIYRFFVLYEDDTCVQGVVSADTKGIVLQMIGTLPATGNVIVDHIGESHKDSGATYILTERGPKDENVRMLEKGAVFDHDVSVDELLKKELN